MEQVRGIVMLIAAGIAIYKGWRIHAGYEALLAYILGALALCLSLWHLTHKNEKRPSRTKP